MTARVSVVSPPALPTLPSPRVPVLLLLLLLLGCTTALPPHPHFRGLLGWGTSPPSLPATEPLGHVAAGSDAVHLEVEARLLSGERDAGELERERLEKQRAAAEAEAQQAVQQAAQRAAQQELIAGAETEVRAARAKVQRAEEAAELALAVSRGGGVQTADGTESR
jgi:hypothetical protein